MLAGNSESKSSETERKSVVRGFAEQCDQIGQNFATLANFEKSLAIS